MAKTYYVDQETKTMLHFNMARQREECVPVPEGSKYPDWKDLMKLWDDNWKLLMEIDKNQKEKGELLWRYIDFGVADGKAIYQITKVNKNTCVVELCLDFPDGYSYEMLGAGPTSVDRAFVEKKVKGRDGLDEIFGRK